MPDAMRTLGLRPVFLLGALRNTSRRAALTIMRRGDPELLDLTEKGLYCAAGDFYIDPWKPVERAVITCTFGPRTVGDGPLSLLPGIEGFSGSEWGGHPRVDAEL